ncbi:MAG: restriction endonuclease subunit S [Bacteroides sp.]|nr:restriction endonuclease subunit S [Bacteroides sp.]
MRFPGFTDEWKEYSIDEIANIYGRIGFRGYTSADLVEKGNGAISLSPSNITNNQLYTDKDNTYISFYKYEESPEIKIFVGDVIFVKTGSTVGKVAYVDYLECEATLNPQLVVFKDIKCVNYLFSQILATNKIQQRVSKITVGGAVPTLSQTELGKVRLFLPGNQEQSKIATLLSLIEKRIYSQNKIIEDLKKLKSAIYETIFNSMKGKMFSLADVAEIIKGKQLNGEFLTEIGDYYVMNGGAEPSGYYHAFNVSANTISISEGGNSCGYIQWNSVPFWSGGHCYTLNIKDKSVENKYLYHYLKWSEPEIMKLRIGSGLPNIQKKDLERVSIIIPTNSTQKEIIDLVDSIDRKIDTECSISLLLNRQKSYLLSTLFI